MIFRGAKGEGRKICSHSVARHTNGKQTRWKENLCQGQFYIDDSMSGKILQSSFHRSKKHKVVSALLVHEATRWKAEGRSCSLQYLR